MSKIKGIYAASVSILDNNFSLDVEKTIYHVENLIDQGCHGGCNFWKYRTSTINFRK